MTERMEKAHLPWPHTQFYPSLGYLLGQPDLLEKLAFPLIIKSHYSHRGDLVGKVDSVEELKALAPQWSQEPIVLQDFAAGDGWDIKIWVIDEEIFAARRRTPLDPHASKEDIVIDELPVEWTQIIQSIGKTFDLHLYGVDLLETSQGPIIIDVNSFPGFRGVPGADDALVTLVEKLLATA
jgi:ribosomal protein S6--L-glutamate ligase